MIEMIEMVMCRICAQSTVPHSDKCFILPQTRTSGAAAVVMVVTVVRAARKGHIFAADKTSLRMVDNPTKETKRRQEEER